MYFNFHKHKSKAPFSPQTLYNHRLGIEDSSQAKDYPLFSAGIHPWDLNSINISKTLEELKMQLQQPNCIALGECGLDKSIATDLEDQKEIFRKQLALAKKSGIRVLIIHCIKAYGEIIKEKDRCKENFYWVLHGYNGSKALTQELVKKGFYFSLGHLLLNPKSKITTSLAYIPLKRLFFETDEYRVEIESIYKKAGEFLSLDLLVLKKQVKENWFLLQIE